MKPPANPSIGIITIAPTLNRALNQPKVTTSVVGGIDDVIVPKTNAKMIPIINPLTADITPNIKANGTIGTELIVFTTNEFTIN